MILGHILISIIEWIINSNKFNWMLNYLSSFDFVTSFVLKRQTAIKHVAFIMDGNRRYGRKHGLTCCKEPGCTKMYEMIKVCYLMGIKEVSFYAFSLKNFARPAEEIEAMMNMIIKHKEHEIKGIKAQIRIIGRMDLLDDNVRNTMQEIVERTRNNEDINVNIYFAYSAKNEIECGVSVLGNTNIKHRVDILVRTSGERRLSDFMLKECASGTRVEFVECLWPEFSILHLILLFLKYNSENMMYKPR
ncbi:Dehydrodolichyl diphosphate synthase [Astathelohania contejeani]|uniref:Alkyl transferase n=1 Tax=Astathelohania contejeani TaxID=164912 RepID=A0ABQ7HZD3_9MICR|nr:Dehydrodolichyl diphosphate synthase [Thelohania contejeani]